MAGWLGIHTGDYGWIGRLRLMQDGAAVDISSYGTRQFIFRKPNGVTVTKTATFTTDGTDGILQYTVEDGVIDQSGTWRVQARIAKSGVELTSAPHVFQVDGRLDG